MIIVKVRSPFIIDINVGTQIGSKLELFIWNKGTIEPTVPTYSFTKAIPSTTQFNTFYNVSNFVKEYIDNISNAVDNTTATEEVNTEWCNFKVKRYWNDAGVYTLLDAVSYVGVNGFTSYSDGVNKVIETKPSAPFYALINPNIIQYKKENTTNYFNFICEIDPTSGQDFIARYYNKNNNLITSLNIPAVGDENDIYNYRVPLTYGTTESQKVVIDFNSNFYTTIYSESICENKYEPVVCSYINRYGGWQFLTFFKTQTNSINVKKETFKLSPQLIDYNILKGQSKSFNFNGTQSIKLNTGWVDENYSELITDLLLSETVLLDQKPVKLKTESTDLKSSLKDRMINYEIEFEYAYNLLNDVV